MLSPEQLQDPTFAFEKGAVFAERFGITYDPLREPQAYDEAMLALNPRTAKQLLRFELEAAETVWDSADDALVHRTAEELGIKEREYGFTNGEAYDLLVVAGGARDAMPDRATFAAQALAGGHIAAKKTVVVGDPRGIPEKEQAYVAGWAPGITTGYGMANATVQKLRTDYPEVFGENDEQLAALHLQTAKPDQRAAVNEVILREGIKRGGRIAVATSALYVPFKTHKSQAVGTPLGVAVDVVGVASRPEVVARRTTDTYFSEVTQTLMSAAQHRAATRRL